MTYIYDGLLAGMSEDDLFDHFCGEEAKKRREEREKFDEKMRKMEEAKNDETI